MSKDTRFKPGQSGNPKGRPKRRRPNVSAFDVVFEQSVTSSKDGVSHELSIEEALQQQTLKDAFAGKRLAIRKVLKMIEKREMALAKKAPAKTHSMARSIRHSARNADEALRLLGVADYDGHGSRMKLQAWAVQAALSRPGRKKYDARKRKDIQFFTFDAETLSWPRGRVE